jgi:hypothetical protein
MESAQFQAVKAVKTIISATTIIPIVDVAIILPAGR